MIILTKDNKSALQTLQSLIETKKVDYDFNFYSLPIPTDVPVLILSQGRSLLHAALSLTIPLQMTTTPGNLDKLLTKTVGSYLPICAGCFSFIQL